jgi:hypothetical protein
MTTDAEASDLAATDKLYREFMEDVGGFVLLEHLRNIGMKDLAEALRSDEMARAVADWHAKAGPDAFEKWQGLAEEGRERIRDIAAGEERRRSRVLECVRRSREPARDEERDG